MKRIFFLIAVSLLLSGKAWASPGGATLNAKAGFKVDSLQFSFMLVDNKWQGGKFRDHKSRVLPDGSVMADYQVDFGKANGSLSVIVSPVTGKKDAFRIVAECKYPEGVKKGVRALGISIPVKEAGKAVFFRNGKKIDFKFPEKYKKMELGTFGGCTGGELLLTNGRKLSFQSKNTVYLQDSRKFKLQDFSMRF